MRIGLPASPRNRRHESSPGRRRADRGDDRQREDDPRPRRPVHQRADDPQHGLVAVDPPEYRLDLARRPARDGRRDAPQRGDEQPCGPLAADDDARVALNQRAVRVLEPNTIVRSKAGSRRTRRRRPA